ncbi:MAG TPA: helix-turn-helix domain-containing protein [Rhizomicrobium sp.]|nr:helix-turn-helix domain-containing protein [Rhizomicrobium sp.]
MDKLTAVSKIKGFGVLPETVRQRIAAGSGLQHIDRGSSLFREGERAHFVYAVIEGAISLHAGQDNASGGIADFLGAGDAILIPPALLDLPYMATARAVTDVLVLLIPAVEFRRLAESELSFAIVINRTLAMHWRLLFKQLRQAKTRDADTRVARFLLDNIHGEVNTATVLLPSSRRQVAAHLGMTPETLSRAFRRLRDAGITSRGSEVLVKSVSQLAVIARRSN